MAHKDVRRAPRIVRAGKGLLRPLPRTLLVGLTTLSLIGAGVSAAMASGGEGSITVTRDGAVLDGREVNGYIHIKANNVSIKNSTLRYHGNYTIRVFSGFTGATIENTKIFCTAAKTHGVVFGNYTARKVHVSGCVNGFVYSEDAPATIVDSTWNGKPVSARSEIGPVPEPPPSSASTSRPDNDSAAVARASEIEPIRETESEAQSSADAAAASGFPGPGNTGVKAGTSLKSSGSLTIKTDGAVIEGLNINGCVVVSAKDVVIRNTRISCGATYGIRTLNAKNLLVEDAEIDGKGKIPVAVCCGDYTLRRVEVTNSVDGPRLGTNTVVEDSWIHHLKRLPGTHNDTLQTTGASNIVVRGNRLEPYYSENNDPMNACLMIGSTTAPIVSNLLFEGNYCNGGNYSIGVRTDLNASGIRLRDNVFGRDHRYGVVARPSQSGISWDRATNVYVDSLKPVVN